jgi:hypothetical protein
MSYTNAYITPSSFGVFSNHTLYIMYHVLRTYVLVRLLQKPNAWYNSVLIAFQLALAHKIRISLIRTPDRVATSTKQQSACPPKKHCFLLSLQPFIQSSPFRIDTIPQRLSIRRHCRLLPRAYAIVNILKPNS